MASKIHHKTSLTGCIIVQLNSKIPNNGIVRYQAGSHTLIASPQYFGNWDLCWDYKILSWCALHLKTENEETCTSVKWWMNMLWHDITHLVEDENQVAEPEPVIGSWVLVMVSLLQTQVVRYEWQNQFDSKCSLDRRPNRAVGCSLWSRIHCGWPETFALFVHQTVLHCCSLFSSSEKSVPMTQWVWSGHSILAQLFV